MKYSELKKLNCVYNGIEFTPIYNVDNYILIKNGDENIIDFELEGFKLIKTAEQNYKDSNSVIQKEATKEEQLQKQLLETQNMLLELQYKLTNKDLTNNLK
ncbi:MULTISPECIES: hypothetical protein [unclassified Clostridium]|uniref:hypothetical protein n=1 Tax=unclassified Clostridium TaxID=2614128 RepID=UPI0013F72C19|nr:MULTISPECIES: hypothetical protein [unclassified Clostridium]NFR85819.1 hypothetical protein [Clostridium botulinum]NFR91453.1 hypothetical protein [Clostridium botulinum]